TASFPQVQPHETGHFRAFVHEFLTPLVEFFFILHRLRPRFLITACLAQRGLRGQVVLPPLGILLMELLVADPFRRKYEADAITNEEVELAVAIYVRDPNTGRAHGAGEVALGVDLTGHARPRRLDQRSERQEVWRLPLAGLVLRPPDSAVFGATHQVQIAVA